jgi:phosphotransacetylase
MDLIGQLTKKIKSPVQMAFCERNADLVAAVDRATEEGVIVPVFVETVEEAAGLVADGGAAAMVAGIDLASRDVILAAKNTIGMRAETFSSSFVFDFPDGRALMMADCATCKNPSAEQLADIVQQTVEVYGRVFDDGPRVAMLSWSTLGSCGKTDEDIEKIREAMRLVRGRLPGLAIDGEMQLDAAVNPQIGRKKAPGSGVAGRANVLICPDLNSGNLLYKAFEQFGGAHAYGPILQGFNGVAADLSRGSTAGDVYGTILVTALRAGSEE